MAGFRSFPVLSRKKERKKQHSVVKICWPKAEFYPIVTHTQLSLKKKPSDNEFKPSDLDTEGFP